MKKLTLGLVLFTFYTNIYAQNRSVPLPDGSSVTIRAGETPQQAWLRAQVMYPEAFGFKAIAEDKKYDLDYFNECKMKATKDTKTDKALSLAVESCQYKAIPKKCRSFPIIKDPISNEKGDERVRCVEECNNASYYSKSVGECSKG